MGSDLDCIPARILAPASPIAGVSSMPTAKDCKIRGDRFLVNSVQARCNHLSFFFF